MIFDKRWIKNHNVAIWKFKLLAFFGLAKWHVAVDPARPGGDCSSTVEGYLVNGRLYITKMTHVIKIKKEPSK